ncbi:exopolysaccharide biosynthesis polyprenyl glycosylphosphotransferase [Komagataeibacter rhaeticus]|uniref:exopolysaccharide biosynthesis polyprenyl glycosylphosphotransferase n=1 Tax=Komagataeibacter rhaeticus TaxID=215221 RepID=UPI0039EA3B79
MSEALRQLKNGEPDLSLSTMGESRLRLPHLGRRADDGSFSYRHPVLPQIVILSDALCVCLAVMACIAWQRLYDMPELSGALLLANIMAAGAFFLFPRNVPLLDIPDVTRLSAQLRYLLPPVLFGAVVFCGVLLMLSWPMGVTLRRASEWLVFVALMLAAERIVGTYLLHTDAVAHRLARRVAIIGSGPAALRMAARINAGMQRSFRLVGLFDDRGGKVDGTVEELVVRAREEGIDAVIMNFSPEEGGQQHVMEELWRLRGMLADVYVVPTLMTEDCHGWPVERFGPFSLTVLQRRPLSEWDMLEKRAFDLTASVLLLLALSPVLVLVALAIKLDSRGPVLFCQPRLGYNNLYFDVFKFRSMYTDMADRDAARQTSRTDPRVTRVGRWIRRLSIDELPQLFNVLRGDMSLVGPRPHAPQTRAGGQLLHEAMEEYVARHRVQPGITGWAQINGSRGELVTRDDLRRRVVLDLEYIRAWSIWLDIKIIFLTVKREIFSRNAF